MGYPYKIILCPVDFDDNSMAALTHARRLAIDMGATIHLVHVLPILPTYADQGLAISVDQAAEQEAQRRLKDLAHRRLSRTPAEIHTRIAFVSEVPKTILAFARELAADLIVMATHARGIIGHLFFGSVTEAVVRNAVCPVLTLRFAPEPEPQPQAAEPAATSKGTSGKGTSRKGTSGKGTSGKTVGA
ncbi:MAG TPA: universal stress protein [Candidatus Binataceae bacterium]|nr:universal stress protein [Candidatus Binataceae bacterium]HVB79714.1 universal stress protein [Candidatus Binataceae bacterium]